MKVEINLIVLYCFSIVGRVASTRDARSRIENRRRGKQRVSRTGDDLDEDPPGRRSSDNRGQGRDLRDRLGRRKDTVTTSWKSHSDVSESEKDDFNDSPHSYERLTIEVQQD